MKLSVKAPSTAFCLIGMSLPVFPKKKSFSTIFVFGFSCFKCISHFFLIICFIFDVDINAQSKKVQLCLQVNFAILCCCTFSCFVLSLLNFFSERIFWDLILKMELTLKIRASESNRHSLFILKCFAKIVFPYFGSTWLLLILHLLFRSSNKAASGSVDIS